LQKIDLSIGSGGKAMHDFLDRILYKHFGKPEMYHSGDSALIEMDGKIGFTTDSFVIHPLFFPGGDIGRLAVAGTVNDLVVCGIKPEYLSFSLILEEGFPVEDLEKILESAKETADCSKVRIITGDTKVVKAGEADKIYINTAGIGTVVNKGATEVGKGDVVIITGSPGDHGASIMIARNEFEFEGDVLSDCKPLHELLPLWDNPNVKWMRDITRGGLATVLWELGSEKDVTLVLDESPIPFSPPLTALAEILGIDPLYLPSEGKAVIVADRAEGDNIVSLLRNIEGCEQSTVIGTIQEKTAPIHVILKTVSGGQRILEPLSGELLPRIC